jgi:hypothetical protein
MIDMGMFEEMWRPHVADESRSSFWERRQLTNCLPKSKERVEIK